MSEENSKPSNLFVTPKFFEEVNLSHECKDLINTLPTESGWLETRFHLYQGFWYGTKILQGVLNCRNHFQANDSDILLATLPKSRTTWLKALTFAILNRKTHNPKSCPDMTKTHPLLSANPHLLIPFLEINLYLEKSNPDLTTSPSPRLFASHMPYISLPDSVKQSNCKIVYLCRNPKDLFVSLWHYGNKLSPSSYSIEDFFDKFCHGVSPCGLFWDHMLGYYKEHLERPEKIMFLTYEELKKKPDKVLKDVAKFIGCELSKEEESDDIVSDILRLCSFEKLSNLDVNKSGKMPSGIENNVFFRRGEVGDWKNFLTFDMAEQLDVITQEKLEKHGLKF